MRKKAPSFVLSLIFLAGAAASAEGAPGVAPSGVPTAEDLASLVSYLDENGARVDRELAALTDGQLVYREAEERWTIGEIVEHLVLAEVRINALVDATLASPARPELVLESGPPLKDRAIRMAVANREAIRFQAPEFLRPSGDLKSVEAARRRFAEVRHATLERLRTRHEPLRAHFRDNQGIGMLDAYQWLLFIGAHVERHLQQIEEVEAAPGFYPAAAAIGAPSG